MSFFCLLHISNLTIYYKNEKTPALDNFSFNLNQNGIYLIAGNSGSGKSTLAKALLKLLPKDIQISGLIEINNQNLNSINRNLLLNKVGFLPQFPMDYVLNLLVRDEIAFPLENFGYSKDEIESTVDQILERLNISHLKNKIVTELSSGELQKIALATALIGNPSILILDEPFARIDSSSQLNLLQILKELKKTSIIIILEHHLDYILEISNEIFILDKGKTIAYGNPAEMVDKLGENRPELSKLIIPKNDTKYISYFDLLDDLEKHLKNRLSG